jgi:hypothetical protein
MAFQCDDELSDTIEFNSYSVKVTSKSTFSLTETIWIEGSISSKAYNLSTNDSIFNENNNGNVISIFKFITPTENFNSKDAIDNFEIIYDKGTASFLPSCENAQMTINADLNADKSFYTYRIGIKPKFKGDYIINFFDSNIRNQNKNISIASNYPLERHPNQIGFDRCGLGSWLDIDQSKNEYFFTVE